MPGVDRASKSKQRQTKELERTSMNVIAKASPHESLRFDCASGGCRYIKEKWNEHKNSRIPRVCIFSLAHFLVLYPPLGGVNLSRHLVGGR